jgi:hypothetical protein
VGKREFLVPRILGFEAKVTEALIGARVMVAA